jgi:hypothetical protein
MAKMPVFYGNFLGEHLGILGSYATQINKAAAAWLRWRLMDDAIADEARFERVALTSRFRSTRACSAA